MIKYLKVAAVFAAAAGCLATLAALWPKPHAPALQYTSTFLAFTAANAGDGSQVVELNVGSSRKCDVMQGSDCPMDTVAELVVGGQVVGSIPASSLTKAQMETLKLALQQLVDRSNARAAPQLLFDIPAHSDTNL